MLIEIIQIILDFILVISLLYFYRKPKLKDRAFWLKIHLKLKLIKKEYQNEIQKDIRNCMSATEHEGHISTSMWNRPIIFPNDCDPHIWKIISNFYLWWHIMKKSTTILLPVNFLIQIIILVFGI